jgi:hypothetical protein
MHLEMDPVSRYDGEIGIVCLVRPVDIGDLVIGLASGHGVVFRGHIGGVRRGVRVD